MAAETTKSGIESSTDRWENEGGPPHLAGVQPPGAVQPDLEKLGITPVQLTVFDCAGYRYSNLRDAIAAAKRAIEAGAN
jgi:hypothetical protein